MFIRVEPQHAGPQALGILIPPGARTLVIVRPRALEWDLLPARWDGASDRAPEFCVFGREEAAGIARRLIAALESATARIESFGQRQQDCVQLWLRTEEFVWIVCQRTQGKAYQPLMFTSPSAAAIAAEQLAPFVCPAAEAKQEYYFNTQKFT